jgi:hypothetical protein
MPTTEYSLHGVNVQIEFLERVINYPQRAAWGTRVRQYLSTDNWFHLAPTTPTLSIDNATRPLYLERASLIGELKNARIEEVQLWNGSDLVWALNDRSRLPIASELVVEVFPKQGSSFRVSGQVGRRDLLIGNRGLCLSVRIAFLGESEKEGEVIFRAAGFDFSAT